MRSGTLVRERPAGVIAGAPLTRVSGPLSALALVGEDLGRAEQMLGELVVSDVSEVPKIAGYLVAAGGKRLRPALTALGARAVGYRRPIHRLMCVGELIHLGSLLHDDVVDGAETRRGKPAAHHVFGSAATVLTGDFCLARAVLLASEEGGHDAVTALARAVTEMAEGEVLQLKHAGDLDCTYTQYLDVLQRKSAALIAWCVAAPARAQGDTRAADILERYGRAVGVAFQITDDVLDYTSGTGKTPGADLRERKVTLPLLYAMDRDPSLKHQLLMAPPTDREVIHLMDRVRSLGALDDALTQARAFVEEGLTSLRCLPENEGRRALEVLGSYLVERAS